MRTVLLARFGEVHLKGQNRPYFLRMLVENVKKTLANDDSHVWLSDSRIYVSDMPDMDECLQKVRRVFGIHSVSPAVELEKDAAAIFECAERLMADKSGTFKVLCKRSDKTFPYNSQTLAAEAGGRILDKNPRLTVDVHKPQIKMCIEVRDKAYLYTDELPAVGGMPTGTSGRALLLLSGGIDSPVAGYQIMRRGVSVQAIHFASPPYTSERAREKVLTLAKITGAYQFGMKLHIVPFTDIQMRIHEKCDEGLGTLITRRFMMRISDIIAKQNNCLALITGESIGQVASQTMEALACTDMTVTLPVFRPLIGLDKLEIINIAERIDTYETSILPYEDCCTVFTPRHPVTKPKPDIVAREEARLDIDGLIADAIARTETVIVKD